MIWGDRGQFPQRAGLPDLNGGVATPRYPRDNGTKICLHYIKTNGC